MKGRLTIERNKLKRKREVGLNLRGEFLAPDTQECKSILRNISILQNVISRNQNSSQKSFQLGPMKEKALIKAFLYPNYSNEVQLNIIEITPNDDIELAWKRQINRLYHKQCPKFS